MPTTGGVNSVGSTLTANPGTWDGTAPITFAYVWEICDGTGAGCHDISGATSQTYTLKADDAGNTVRVRVTATNTDGSASARSAPSAKIAASTAGPVNTVSPSITGAASDGQHAHRQQRHVDRPGADHVHLRVDDLRQQRRRLPRHLGCDREHLRPQVRRRRQHGARARDGEELRRLDQRHERRDRRDHGRQQRRRRWRLGLPDAARRLEGGRREERPAAGASPGGAVQDHLRHADAADEHVQHPLRDHRHVRNPVAGALVYPTAVPYNQFTIPAEKATDATGAVTMSFNRLSEYPASAKQQQLTMFVRARRAGDNVLAGISTRRLIAFLDQAVRGIRRRRGRRPLPRRG